MYHDFVMNIFVFAHVDAFVCFHRSRIITVSFKVHAYYILITLFVRIEYFFQLFDTEKYLNQIFFEKFGAESNFRSDRDHNSKINRYKIFTLFQYANHPPATKHIFESRRSNLNFNGFLCIKSGFHRQVYRRKVCAEN